MPSLECMHHTHTLKFMHTYMHTSIYLIAYMYKDIYRMMHAFTVEILKHVPTADGKIHR